MLVRSIFAFLAIATSISANAAPEWIAMDGSNADSTFVDSSSFLKQGNTTDVTILRDFNETITLGNDPDSGVEMYPHRSVKLTYKVDCGKGAIAMSEWKMYAGNLGNGEVVWADKEWGRLDYIVANDDETRSVLGSTCGTKTAMR